VKRLYAGRRLLPAAQAIVLVLAVGAPAAALAGRHCEEKPLSVAALQQGLELARRTAEKLDASGAKVVVIARAGQDLSRYGLRYSHAGLAYRDTASGRWRVVHKLNHCGTDHAALYRQGLGEFFLDSPFRYEAAVMTPTPAAQEALLAILTDRSRVGRMHTPAYNMVAYPWSMKYQQSNQWMLETFAMAQQPSVTGRRAAQEWLMRERYVPTSLRIPAFTRLGARMTSANVAFDDHPSEQRYSGRIDTVTVDSLFEWLRSAGYASGPVVIR
jgi:hypothetical protein